MKPMLNRDSVWFGLAIGMIIPIIVYALLLLLYHFLDTVGVFNNIGFAEDFRTRTLALVSICTNLVIMQTFRKMHRNHETIRGILIASMILVGIWFWKFGIKLLQF